MYLTRKLHWHFAVENGTTVIVMKNSVLFKLALLRQEVCIYINFYGSLTLETILLWGQV